MNDDTEAVGYATDVQQALERIVSYMHDDELKHWQDKLQQLRVLHLI